MKKILLLIGLVLLQVSAYAGNTISGRILDDVKGDPLIGATAAILDENGSILTGASTDTNGKFTIRNINNGSYVMLFNSSDMRI